MSNAPLNMKYTLGKDMPVNRMGYGAMRITGKGVWGPPQDPEEAIRVLRRAVELGVNFIDTADSYGPDVSELLIAEALYPYAPGLVIATKGGFERTGPDQWHINSKPKHLQEALEGSLQRLKTDTIDLYQLHRIDPTVPFKETLAFLQQAQQQGLIKHIGLSEVSIAEIKQAQEMIEVVSVQNKYSFDYRKWEPELQYCQEQGIGFIPWNPINANNADSMQKAQEIADKHGVSAQQIALSWLLHHAPNILLIPGTSKVKHLEENIKAKDIVLDAADMAALDNVAPFGVNK